MIYERRRDGVADNYLSDQEQSVGALLRKHNSFELILEQRLLTRGTGSIMLSLEQFLQVEALG